LLPSAIPGPNELADGTTPRPAQAASSRAAATVDAAAKRVREKRILKINLMEKSVK